jgi:hypothetical protein
MTKDELKKIIAVKTMDIKECEQELNNRYYPTVVRMALRDYILKMKEDLEIYKMKLSSNRRGKSKCIS